MVLKYILDIVSADVNAIPDFTACGDGLFAVEETLSLSGLAGFYAKYEPVFLAGKYENF